MAVRTKDQIATDIAAKLADNTDGDISAQDLREVATDLNDTLDTKTGAPSAATEDAAGVVQGATSAQSVAASGTTILAWTNNRIRQLITAALPTVSAGDSTAGTSTARRAWTAARVKAAADAAITALVPAVFRQGNTDLIATSKLGSGTRDGTTWLKGDGTFSTGPTPSEGGPLNAVALVQVGNTVNFSSSAAVSGPAFSDLSDVFWISFVYTRSPNSSLRFNTLLRKSEIEGVAAASAYRVQLQGGGGAFIGAYDDGSGNLAFSALDSAYSVGACDIYKLTGSEDGITMTAGDARYLQLSGGTLTGLLTLSGAPTADLHAATKKYVDDNAGGGGSNVPNRPSAESTVKKYVLNIAVDGTGTWVEETEGGSSFAPSKSNIYDAVKAIFHPATNAGVTADDTNNELDIAAGGGSDGGAGITEVYDSGSFVNIAADTWIEATFSEAFADTDQLIFVFQRRLGSPPLHGVAEALVYAPWELIAESNSTTHATNADQVSTQFVVENLGSIPSDAETAIVLRKRTDGSIGYLFKDAITTSRVRIYKAQMGGGGGGDTTAIENELDEIEATLDLLDVPEVVGDFADANADNLAAGYGVYPSEDGTFSDSDFVLSGTTPTAGTNRFFVRTPKHASRFGARIVLDTTPAQVLPDNDPLTEEHLVKVATRPDDAQDDFDYFFVGVTHDDAPIQDANVNAYKLQVAPVTRQEIINIGYWQDENRTPNVAPATKSIATVRAGELFPVVFPAHDRPRNLHFALAARYEITALYIAGSSALTDFSKVAESRLANFWHSARIQSTGEVSCLIRIEEA